MTTAALMPEVEYIENGVTLDYAVPFRFFAPDDIEVDRITAEGQVIELVYGADYIVSGGQTDSGGRMLLNTLGVIGNRLRIRRVTPRTQTMDYATNDTFPAESHEGAIDKLTLVDQEQDVGIADLRARALLVPDGERSPSLPRASDRVGKSRFLGHASDGVLELIDLAAIAKGDPGGNIMAIGLFAAASGLVIDAGTEVLRTSGFATLGHGASFYRYDADVDADYVTANPLTAFIASGRGFRLDTEQVISPEMFGAEPWDNRDFDPLVNNSHVGCPDATSALQAFFDFIVAHDNIRFDATGKWGVTTTMRFGPTVVRREWTCRAGGVMELIALGAIAGPMFQPRNMFNIIWDGSIVCVGNGASAYSSRNVQAGVVPTGQCIFFSVTGSIRAYAMQFAGVAAITESAGDFMEAIAVGYVSAIWCGSGRSIDAADNDGNHVTSAYTARTNIGAAFTDGQYSRIEVATLPPEFLDASYGAFALTHAVLVKIGGNFHNLVGINRGAGTIDVFPWVRLDTPAAGTLMYYFGGSVMTGGGDGNLLNIGVLNATGCGIGLNNCGLYPGEFAQVWTQSCGVSLVVGAKRGSPVLGGCAPMLYSEEAQIDALINNPGNNTFDIGEGIYSLDKIITLYENDGVTDGGNPGFNTASITREGLMLRASHRGREFHLGTANDTLGVNGQDYLFDRLDNHTVILKPFETALDRLFRVRQSTFLWTGTGANGAPTGTIAINAAAIAGKLINGAASVSFTNLKAPLHVVVTCEPATGNFFAVQLSARAQAAIANVGAAPTAADHNAVLAVLRNAGIIAP